MSMMVVIWRSSIVDDQGGCVERLKMARLCLFAIGGTRP